MTARTLEVLANDQLVGCLRENNDLWEFEYGESWATSPQGFDLSPALRRLQREPASPAAGAPGATAARSAVAVTPTANRAASAVDASASPSATAPMETAALAITSAALAGR